MERLSLLDAQFLHLEDVRSPMHVGCICVFDGPVPTAAEMTRLFQTKLDTIPRYRQRLSWVPLELGRPVWVDDVQFELDYHLRRTALPAPGDDAALRALMGRIMSQRLDRKRPLWEAWVVEGLAGERWALISKIHHCMVDGISGIDLLGALLDLDPHAVLAETRPWRPSPEPSGAELVLDAWSGLAADARGWVEKVEHGVAYPREGLQAAAQVGLGLLTFAQRLVATRGLFRPGQVGAHRRYAFASVQLDDLRFIRKSLGGTLNDVVLAAISGAYRTLLARHQVDVDHAALRSLVPVSVRGVDEKGVAGNRVSAILCDLPVHLADPVARLSAVREQMMRLKASHMAEAGERVTDLGNLAPPMIVGPITRLIARMMHELPQKAVQTVTTNVPGPPVPLYCLGRRLRENYPYVPITQGMRSGIAVLSYSGQISFGITGDYDTAKDVELLAQAIVDEISTLRSLAQEAQTQQSRSTV